MEGKLIRLTFIQSIQSNPYKQNNSSCMYSFFFFPSQVQETTFNPSSSALQNGLGFVGEIFYRHVISESQGKLLIFDFPRIEPLTSSTLVLRASFSLLVRRFGFLWYITIQVFQHEKSRIRISPVVSAEGIHHQKLSYRHSDTLKGIEVGVIATYVWDPIADM